MSVCDGCPAKVTYANDSSCSYLRWTRREECELKGKLVDAEKWRRLVKANPEADEILEICYGGNEKPIIVPESIKEDSKSRRSREITPRSKGG